MRLFNETMSTHFRNKEIRGEKMRLFNERMSTHFRKKEIRGGKNDVLLVLHWGTSRDLPVDTGNLW